MAGQGTSELVRADGLEIPGCRQVPGFPLGPPKRAVGNLPDQRLDERELTVLWRAWIRISGQELAADQVAQSRIRMRPYETTIAERLASWLK